MVRPSGMGNGLSTEKQQQVRPSDGWDGVSAAHFIAKHEDVLFLAPPGTGKSHLAHTKSLAHKHV